VLQIGTFFQRGLIFLRTTKVRVDNFLLVGVIWFSISGLALSGSGVLGIFRDGFFLMTTSKLSFTTRVNH
jgi:hypothetical protein